ncbi:pimeloyl-ACP methyl ester carboxylesterase [Larkinella arboricola]|uniref:Pimeloyl-ACP methyl ester carboxylesterase n=1 Tax=Larkinella arboricola TaxID=643671 RepID=A0A327WTB4_LARAB|nr:alpha/beta hydrolase [Larkinella arboricola]RAJ95620.1 pimeloyl-ACP methyl ester carboxylesterase [Larkinella arboricola]
MSDKPVIVLIHGHGVNASIWDAVYDNLSADFSIIKSNFSEHTKHESIDAYAEEVFSQLQTSQIQSCVLVGHSMGGYIALAFAEQHPELVQGLVLINSTAFADDEAKKQSRQKAVETMEASGSGAFIEQTVPKMFGESYSRNQPEVVKKQVEQFSALPAEALIAGVKAMASRPDRTHVLKEASFPVLLIAGREDQIIPFAKSQELFEAAPQAKTVVLEKAGHLGMIESPDEVIRAIREFVGPL